MNGSNWCLAALALFCLSTGCSRPPAASVDPIRPVKTIVVEAGGNSHTRSFPGKVEASKKVELAFQVPGLLVQLPVREGQKIAKGEVIGQLRQDEFQARLKTLQGQLDQARAVLASVRAGERPEERLRREADVRAAEARMVNARVELDRSARLVRSSAVARSEYDAAQMAFRVAQQDHEAAVQLFEKGTIGRDEDIEAKEASVRGLEGRVVEANLQLEDSTLRAPYDGVIAKRFVEQNQNVRAKEPIVRFQDVDEIDIAVDVPEIIMAAIRSSDILQLEAEFGAAPGVLFPVHIKEIAQVADPTTQTFKVRVSMKSPTEVNLLPGMTATVNLTYRRAKILGDRILVPIAAVFKDATGEQIAWVIDPVQGGDAKQGTVSRRKVKIGAATGGQVEIIEGLQPGDRVAVAGVPNLREGMKVRDLGDALGGG